MFFPPLEEHKDFLQCHYPLHKAFVFLAVVAQTVSFCSQNIFTCSLSLSHAVATASVLQVKSGAIKPPMRLDPSDDVPLPKSQEEGRDSALFLSLSSLLRGTTTGCVPLSNSH